MLSLTAFYAQGMTGSSCRFHFHLAFCLNTSTVLQDVSGTVTQDSGRLSCLHLFGTEWMYSNEGPLLPTAIHEFPEDIFTKEQRKKGAVLLHALCVSITPRPSDVIIRGNSFINKQDWFILNVLYLQGHLHVLRSGHCLRWLFCSFAWEDFRGEGTDSTPVHSSYI